MQLQGHAAPSDADGLAGAQQHQLQIIVTGGAAGHAVAQALVPDLYAALAFILGHTAAVVVAVHVASIKVSTAAMTSASVGICSPRFKTAFRRFGFSTTLPPV